MPALVPDDDRHRAALHLDAAGLEPVVDGRYGDRSTGPAELTGGHDVGAVHARRSRPVVGTRTAAGSGEQGEG